MKASSRTPEGRPNRCSLCGHPVCIEPSLLSGDAACPVCGNLLWFQRTGFQPDELPVSDQDLATILQRVRADEAGAFEQLVGCCQHWLVAVMRQFVGNAEEAEALTQEVFLRIYKARKRHPSQSRISTWLLTVANQVALNRD